MKNTLTTAVAVLATAVAVNASAQNVDSKDCPGLHNSHMMVQLGDVVVKQGEVAKPTYSFKVTAYLDKDYTQDIYVDMINDYCIDGECHHDVWPQGYVRPLYGYHVENMGTLDLHKVMLTKGTYNTTFRLHSKMLKCDVTAVGTIFVQ